VNIVRLLSEVQRTCKWCHVAMQSQLRTTIVQDDQFLMVSNVTFNTAFLSQSHVTCNACINCLLWFTSDCIVLLLRHWLGCSVLTKKFVNGNILLLLAISTCRFKSSGTETFFLTSDWLFIVRTLKP